MGLPEGKKSESTKMKKKYFFELFFIHFLRDAT